MMVGRAGVTDDSIQQKPRHGRQRHITDGEVETLLAAYRDGMTAQDAARTLHTGHQQVLRWCERDEALAARVAQARAEGHAILSARAKAAQAQTMVKTNAMLERRRRGWCDDATCGACRSCRRRAEAKTRRPRSVIPVHRVAWGADEIATLRRLAGTHRPDEIADAINAANMGIGPTRTARAVAARAATLGVSLDVCTPLTIHDLTTILGAARATILRAIRAGHLDGRRPRESRGSRMLVRPEDVERLLLERPWTYAPQGLGAGRLGDIGRLRHRADPWWAATEIAAYLGACPSTVRHYWRVGVLPFKTRIFGSSAGPRANGGVRVTRRRDVIAYAAATDSCGVSPAAEAGGR